MNGIDNCWKAFERLKEGTPLNPQFADREITSSLVSEEAGYDRGYLKKSRALHITLIRAIELYRSEKKIESNTPKLNIKRLREKVETQSQRANELEIMLHKSLARELKLANQLRQLEIEIAQLKKTNNVTSFASFTSQSKQE